MRRACIDIGSNTTRLLVADCDADGLVEIHQERAFTHVRRALTPGADIGAAKIDEVVAVVAAQIRKARDLAHATAPVWLGDEQPRRVRADVDAGEAQAPQTAMIRR